MEVKTPFDMGIKDPQLWEIAQKRGKFQIPPYVLSLSKHFSLEYMVFRK